MSHPNLPSPPEAPEDGYNTTWEPETYPATIMGTVEDRETLEFRKQRDDDRTHFEKLVVRTTDGALVDVLGGRAHLARLIAKYDPQPGDGIAITAFGENEKGAYEFGLNLDTSARPANHGGDQLDLEGDQ